MKPYSHDLRIRVLAACDGGDVSVDDVAERFCVARSWVYRLLQRRRETGSIAPQTHRCGRHPVFRGEALDALDAYVQEHSDATLAEIHEHFADTVTCSQTTIDNTLQRLGYRLKKNAARGGTGSARRPSRTRSVGDESA